MLESSEWLISSEFEWYRDMANIKFSDLIDSGLVFKPLLKNKTDIAQK